MVKGRGDAPDVNAVSKPLRIVASGTVFLTNTLSLQSYPVECSVVRAQTVSRTRGGAACNVLSTLAQFPNVEPLLVAPFGSDDDAKQIAYTLEDEGVSMRHCKVWEGCGVPNAWVIKSGETGSRTVINHNPLPDITHEEFVSLLGPLLVPENYPVYETPASTKPAALAALSSSHPPSSASSNPLNPAPFDWIHFEGRSVRTTLSNITGIDGLARERKWRNHCVFSLDVSRKLRQGVEALIPHADVIFFSKQYALSHSASPEHTTPRTFLLSMSRTVPQHALLVAFWGTKEKEGGAAVLSMPTREYLQSSGWVGAEDFSGSKRERANVHTQVQNPNGTRGRAVRPEVSTVGSVRSGSGFWAIGHHGSGSESLSAYTYTGMSLLAESAGVSAEMSGSREYNASHQYPDLDSVVDTEFDRHGVHAGGDDAESDKDEEESDSQEAYEVFVAGMIYALSRRILPGDPYTPTAVHGTNRERSDSNLSGDRDRWRLDECLRFASELAGRAMQRKNKSNMSSASGVGASRQYAQNSTNDKPSRLADEMARAGWFEG